MKKCPYCDFNSHEQRQALPEARYVDALMTDLESALPSIWGRKFSSVFFGGGTPSLFSPASIDAILAGVRARMPVPADDRGHARSESRHVRGAEVRRIQKCRHQPVVDRHPELQPSAPEGAGAACMTMRKRIAPPRSGSPRSATSIST
jgi:hypothetical protein